ncbi:4Fe-4S dicluster domain-containing protein [Succinimonas sp.]|uniref:4Fe-4S dicluster domain-containing protein n=1 Tax=Succinimonas sp. TaxID=1936151 RepID=UPI003870CD47
MTEKQVRKTINYELLKKGGFMRQKQKGYFSLRLQVVGGTLTSENIRVINEVADKYGHGYVHLTSRQGVEIPFISAYDIDDVRNELAKGGVTPGVCGPRVRTVTACQGNEICPSGCINTQELARELSARYFGRELPHKFKLGVTGCSNNCLKAEENDLGIKGGMDVVYDKTKCKKCKVCVRACLSGALSKDAEGYVVKDDAKCTRCGRCARVCSFDCWSGACGYRISFGGTFGNCIRRGEEMVPLVKDKEMLFRIVDATLDYFNEHAKPGERFRKTLERLGDEEFRSIINAVFRG